jgi:hypothetical protein
MGTNYYTLKTQECPKCGHRTTIEEEDLHIGKSSAGWCFSLHAIPERGLHDLADWQMLFKVDDPPIRDEYGRAVSVLELLDVITDRGRDKGFGDKPHPLHGCDSWTEFHRMNDSEFGPHGLLRHRLGNGCIRHGEGTWDCIKGEFS